MALSEGTLRDKNAECRQKYATSSLTWRGPDSYPSVAEPVTISGKLGDDAKSYQIRAVKRAVEEAKE
jgi:hypothetical protein